MEITWDASGPALKGFYLLVAIILIYLIYKYRKRQLSMFIILLFFNGLFAFLGKDVQNYYRISLVGYLILVIVNSKRVFRSIRQTKSILLSFLVFSGAFLLTAFINNDYFFITFSQYSRYFIIYFLFIILRTLRENEYYKYHFSKVIKELLTIQIVLSLAKFLIIGIEESVVGSVASQGGAVATSLPMLGFMFIWVNKKGLLERKDWIFIIGLLFIGFVSGKRAIWFIMPVILTFFLFYIPQKKIPIKVILLSILFVPLVFYFGVKLNPSLNKEEKIWGSFDPEYAINYARVYTFGDKDNRELGTGRGGSNLLLIDKLKRGNLIQEDFFGSGLRFMYTTTYDEFAELGFGINHKGAATGVFQTLVSNGFVGIIATLWFALSLFSQIINKRLRYVIIGFFLWEYFFYTGSLLRDMPLALILIYIILFSSSEYIGKNKSIYPTPIN
jgi:hypothetical protein